jgi:Icc-related predicted phosphoesterase
LLALNQILRKKPDVLLLHQGPEGVNSGQLGHAGIRTVLEAGESTLVFCGHVHWEQPYAELPNGTQICNADGKAFIFSR